MTARTTPDQRAEISRKNGCMSRGPISPEGKTRSRMNSVKHGMTARIPVLPGEDPETFRQHVEGIVDSVAPRNPLELGLAEQAALSLWKIERAERAEATRVAATVRAAEAHADEHQQEELCALGLWLVANTVKTKQIAAADLLAFLPAGRHAPFQAGRGEPMVVLHRIQATVNGCQWLLERWDRLRGRLEQNGSWDIEEMIAAAQLRGQRPLFMETADWQCLVQERYVKDNSALVEEGRSQLLDQLTDGEWLAADPAGTRVALLRLVAEETARLEELKDARQQREAADRSELADRLAVDTTLDGERVRRYQLDCDRKLHRALQSLMKLRRDEGGAADPDAEDVPGPAGSVEPPNGLTPAVTDVPVTASEPVEPESGLTPTATALPAIAMATIEAIEPEDGEEGAQEAAWAPPVPPVSAAADREPIGPNEPTPQTDGEPGRQNEPSPAGAGGGNSRNEPSGSGRIAAASVPALAFALLILLATRLSGALAGSVAGPTGEPGATVASKPPNGPRAVTRLLARSSPLGPGPLVRPSGAFCLAGSSGRDAPRVGGATGAEQSRGVPKKPRAPAPAFSVFLH